MPWSWSVLLLTRLWARRRGPAITLGVLMVGAQVWAQPATAGLSSADGAVVFARGQAASVRAWEIADDQGLKAVGPTGEKIAFAADDLLCVDAGIGWSGACAPRVLLRNGESFNARLAAGSTGKRLVFESPLLGKLELDAGDVASYQALGRSHQAGQGQVGPASQLKDHPAPPFILLKNGDLIASGIEQVRGEQVAVNTEFGQTQIPLESIAAVVLSAETPPFDGRQAKPFEGLRAGQTLVELVDGQRLYCDRVTQAAGRVVLSRGAGECRVEPSAVGRIVWPGATIAYLSETPSKSGGRSYFGHPVEPGKNRNASGGPLRIDNSWFSSGLGMRPRSRRVFQLRPEAPGAAKDGPDGSWLYLAGYVGMDPMLGQRGNCEIVVNVDGKAALKSSLRGDQDFANPGESKEGGSIRRLLVPVSGAKQIELQVDFGADGDLGDYVNWCDLLLVGQPLTDLPGSAKGERKEAGGS